VVVGGTFMLQCKKEKSRKKHYTVSSYIPNGSIVSVTGSKTINWYKIPHEPPIEQKYFEVVTLFGKKGFILESETEPLADYTGKYLFPRTQIFIYRILSKVSDTSTSDELTLVKTTKPLIDAYYRGELSEKSVVVLSSTYPKDKKPLRVNTLSENQDFYEVEAEFLGPGVKGYVLTDDIVSGKAVMVNPSHLQSYHRNWSARSEELKEFITRVSPKIAEKIDNLSELSTGLEFCRTNFKVKFEGHIGVNLWWTSAKIGAEGELEIKPKYRTYRYSSVEIENGGHDTMNMEIIKHIECDDDRLLWPIVVKLNIDDEIILEIHRNNLTSLQGFRNFGDITEKNQINTLLTIENYNGWLSAFQHFNTELKPWKGQIGDFLPVIIDILVDNLAFYPPSELRRGEG
jgi:hypothetical protein